MLQVFSSCIRTHNGCRYLVQQMGRWRPRRQLLKVRCFIASIVSRPDPCSPVKQNLKLVVRLNSTQASLVLTPPATNTSVSFFRVDVAPMAGSVNISIVSLVRTLLFPTLPKIASPAKSLPTIVMIWVVLAVSTDRTEPYMSVVSRRQVLDQKQRKL